LVGMMAFSLMACLTELGSTFTIFLRPSGDSWGCCGACCMGVNSGVVVGGVVATPDIS